MQFGEAAVVRDYICAGISTGRWQFPSSLFVLLSRVGKVFDGSWYFNLSTLDDGPWRCLGGAFGQRVCVVQ